MLQGFQILDYLHSFVFGQLAADHAVALRAIIELMPRVRIAGQAGVEHRGAVKRISVEAEFDGIVLLISEVEKLRPLGCGRKQRKQIWN